METAWLLAGDFNSLLSASEKCGGAPFDASRVREFQDCLLDSALADLGFVGPPFTWFRRGTKERLDRGLGNLMWTTQFPDTTVRPRVKSDHRPLLIRSGPEFPTLGPKPFRFIASWLTHRGFLDMLKAAWAKGSDLKSCSKSFARDAAHWNKHTFGHIMRRKDHLLRRIENLEEQWGGDSELARASSRT
ncbi:unnamed protein product [Linum trigynum]|uniref:Uncharacterized protein n=1 Tax=Linum trigynum TaxID=586398 RepID=A0AAV2E073_9ROSI